MPLHMPPHIIPPPLLATHATPDFLGPRAVLGRVLGVLGPQVAVEGALVEVALCAVREGAAEGGAVLSGVFSVVEG